MLQFNCCLRSCLASSVDRSFARDVGLQTLPAEKREDWPGTRRRREGAAGTTSVSQLWWRLLPQKILALLTSLTKQNEGFMFGDLRILVFVCFRSVHGWMGMDVWVNVCLCDAILLRSAEEHLPSFLAVAHYHIGPEQDNWTKQSCLVSWGFCSLF